MSFFITRNSQFFEVVFKIRSSSERGKVIQYTKFDLNNSWQAAS